MIPATKWVAFKDRYIPRWLRWLFPVHLVSENVFAYGIALQAAYEVNRIANLEAMSRYLKTLLEESE